MPARAVASANPTATVVFPSLTCGLITATLAERLLDVEVRERTAEHLERLLVARVGEIVGRERARGDRREQRPARETLDVLRRAESAVGILGDEHGTDPEQQRDHQRELDGAPRLRRDRCGDGVAAWMTEAPKLVEPATA